MGDFRLVSHYISETAQDKKLAMAG